MRTTRAGALLRPLLSACHALMATTPRPVKLRAGTLRWRVQVRERPGQTPTSETFDSPEEAQRFIDYATQFGWAEARRLRDGMAYHDDEIPALGEWLEQDLDALASHATPGTVAGDRAGASRTWLPRLGRIPLELLTREQIQAWVSWQRQQLTHRSAIAREKAAAAIAATKHGETRPAMPEPQHTSPHDDRECAAAPLHGPRLRRRALRHKQPRQGRAGAAGRDPARDVHPHAGRVPARLPRHPAAIPPVRGAPSRHGDAIR